MKYSSQNNLYGFTIIAETGDRFIDFSPYVASINNKGTVAFQAESANGITGIYSGDGVSLNIISESAGSKFKKFYSHPDINDNEEYCFYAELNTGTQGVFLLKNNETVTLTETDTIFKSIGPLGPTMNEEGGVAFRADLNSGNSGVFIGSNKGVRKIADTGTKFNDFFGLPVINDSGTVAFRALMKNGVQGIFASNDESYQVITDTKSEFTDFGRFTGVNDAGTFVFNASLKNGNSGIFTISNGIKITIADTANGFESFRSALINNSGNIIFYAVPREGKEGIFKGNDPVNDKIISLGDTMFDSPVTELALNPVSLNDNDQIALRIKLEDSRQMIVRADLT